MMFSKIRMVFGGPVGLLRVNNGETDIANIQLGCNNILI